MTTCDTCNIILILVQDVNFRGNIIMADSSRSSFSRSKTYPKAQGYSTFDPEGSIDSGLSNSVDNRDLSASSVSGRLPSKATAVEDARERVSISWENINVFVEEPGPSFLKRLCCGTKEHEKPTRKQVLFNGKCIFGVASDAFPFIQSRNDTETRRNGRLPASPGRLAVNLLLLRKNIENKTKIQKSATGNYVYTSSADFNEWSHFINYL